MISLPHAVARLGIFAGQIIFLIALIPTLRGKDKPAITTSIITSIILVIFALTYFSLKLTFATVSSIAMTAAWATLAVQKYRQNSPRRHPESSPTQ